MTTDITELAQSLKAAAEKATPGPWRRASTLFNGITRGKFSLTKEDIIAGTNEKRDAEFIALANPANILALVEALEKAHQRIDELENDEVRQRLANAEHQLYMAELAKHNLKASRKAQFRKRRAAEKRIAELETRTVTVKLPKPHAHLIWIQAGHAPDDYWDDVAVSHSEKDRCCDGSERYPVYARWEIEEMLTAAGIKWEAE
ncbi:ead/Ea22-like family protein [Klebsiella aerogenes]|uniref:ead/Ea22-like family protein n=1 Tax=Klebsiella aerogenes TaxID=548 RepID=UPI0021B300FE|nr:ead/Ea22-like family protein [Klebsiella aerogenes]